MVTLFSSLKIKNLLLKNRLVMAPMCMWQADTEGFVSSFHTVHYSTRAIGGVGLIILEASAVEKRGRISANDIGIWSNEHIIGLKNLVNEVKANGAKVGIQLAHAGRKCKVESETIISCSSERFNENYKIPIAMSKSDISEVVEAFKNAAARSEEIGFDTIEIHAAHGYLINQFLSPLTNKRSDEYGGSLENRTRFLKEILQAVKTVWPKEKPIIVRISAEEFVDNGNHVDDLIEVIKIVQDLVDIVDVSTGGVVENAIINPYPGYQIPYATKIKQELGICTIAGGLVCDAELASEIVSNKRSDLVFLGRELLRNPYFPLHAASILNEEIEWPTPYIRAKK